MDGDAIRELREELGVSQQELARRLQVAHSTVYRWETGQSTPSGKVLARLLRLQRLKEFQNEGRMIRLRDLVQIEEPTGNGLPPWHPESDSIEEGHLSLVSSPPRCGKTLTALRWALATNRHHGIPIYYVSTHWTPQQTLHHLEKAAESDPEIASLDPDLPFHIFQHDGKDLGGMLEELSRRMGDPGGAFVVIDWLQNLDLPEAQFGGLEQQERQLLRDLKIWAAQQRAYVLVIASLRGTPQCDLENFPHFFELADSISLGSVQELRRRRVEFAYQDLHRGGKQTFAFELPSKEEISSLRDSVADGRFRVRGSGKTPRRRRDD